MGEQRVESGEQRTAPEIHGLYLRGERVGLRPPEAGDADRLYDGFNDPEVLQFISSWQPKSRAFEADWCSKPRSYQDDFTFAVVVLADGRHVGNGGLHLIDWAAQCATMGLVIFDRAAQNQGYGREVEALLLRFAFRALNLHRVQASVYSNNPRSRRVAELVGLRYEGARRQRVYRDGRWYDEQVFGILRDEWEADQAAAEEPSK